MEPAQVSQVRRWAKAHRSLWTFRLARCGRQRQRSALHTRPSGLMPSQGSTTAMPSLPEGVYISEATLQSSLAYLRTTLAEMGLCCDLDLMSTEPADVVAACNTIYGLLLQHQKDGKFKEQLKQGAPRVPGPPALRERPAGAGSRWHEWLPHRCGSCRTAP